MTEAERTAALVAIENNYQDSVALATEMREEGLAMARQLQAATLTTASRMFRLAEERKDAEINALNARRTVDELAAAAKEVV